jgi:hypothetical protein
MSTTGTTELDIKEPKVLADGELPSLLSHNSPTRLSPVTKLKKRDVSRIVKYYQPLLAKQYKDVTGNNLPLCMASQQLTNLEVLSKPGTRKSVVISVVMQQAVDVLGDNKRKWFIVYQTNEFGLSKSGEELPSASKIYGEDAQYKIKQRFDSETEEELEPELVEPPYTVYTTEWKREILEKICAGRDTDKIQFSVNTMNGKSYGGFSYEEMLAFSDNPKELIERNRLNRVGEDTDVLFSELSTKDKLFLQNQSKK